MIVFSAAHCDYYVMLSATQHGYLKLLVLSIGRSSEIQFHFWIVFHYAGPTPTIFFPF